MCVQSKKNNHSGILWIFAYSFARLMIKISMIGFKEFFKFLIFLSIIYLNSIYIYNVLELEWKFIVTVQLINQIPN